MAKHEIVGADGRRRIVDDDDDHILADGEKLVVSMLARDSADRLSDVQRAVAASKAQDDFAALCRRAYEIKERAYLDAKAELSDAWKTPPVADLRRKRRGVARDPQGRELSSWEEIEEDDAAPATARVMTADEGRRLKDEAYAQMCQDLRDGWKGNRA